MTSERAGATARPLRRQPKRQWEPAVRFQRHHGRRTHGTQQLSDQQAIEVEEECQGTCVASGLLA
jgi:hypothetical protein